MSAALDLYLSVGSSMLLQDGGNDAAWNTLTLASAEWRRTGHHYSAAYAMERAIHAAWGNGARVDEAVRTSIEDCRRCVVESSLDSLEALAAINLWLGLLRYYEQVEARVHRELLHQELADRLLVAFGDRPDSVGFLVRGIVLSGSLDGGWEAVVPADVTVMGTYTSFGDGRVSLSLPSAFTMFRMLGDYDTLRTFVQRFPVEFDSISLRGWKLVIDAATATVGRAELYQAAANAFAEDVCPTPEALAARGGAWIGDNVNIWAKYFRARAALARIPTTREQAKQYIAEALEALEGTWSGMIKEEPFRLHIIVKALGALVGAEDPSAIEKAVEELGVARWIFGESDEDQEMQRFLTDTAAAVDAFTNDPAAAIASSRIAELQYALAQMPAIGADIAEGVGPAIGAHALAVVQGIDRSSVHRLLEAIDEERILQLVFLRLMQAGLPRYAQVRQGPLEYGKDVVVLVEDSGRRVLRMYQLKVGNIDLPGWRAVTPQLEEIFTVPLETIHIDAPVDERVGFLVCNGHAGPHVDPAMRGWFEQELRDHGHRYEFLHLDALARWIIDARLFGTFRAALREAGLVSSEQGVIPGSTVSPIS